MHPRGHVDDLVILSEWMDTKISLLGTPIRFGLDSLLGLLPISGDLVTGAIAFYSLFRYKQEGASGELLVRMVSNISIDLIVGMIPIAGDIFDIAYKANSRNLEMWFEFKREAKYQGSGRIYLISLVALALFALLVLLLWGIAATTYIISLF